MKELKILDPSLQMRDSFPVHIGYADDTTLLSVFFDKPRLSTEELENACKRWGMKINGAKCNIISSSRESIVIDGQEVGVEDFAFLGSVVPSSGADVKDEQPWSHQHSEDLKRLFGANGLSAYNSPTIEPSCQPIATYASGTWTLKSDDVRKLEVFERQCLRAILGITRLHKVRNEQFYKRLNMKNIITDVIKNKCLRWFGHITRRPNSSMVSKAYHDDFKNPRPRGRPPKRWAAQIREDTGVPLATAERRASDRGSWRRSAVTV